MTGINWIQLWAQIQVVGSFVLLGIILLVYLLWLILWLAGINLNLYKAIRDAHNGRNWPLDVKRDGAFASWNQGEDRGYLKYRDAREVIRKHKLIEKILCRLNYI